MVADRLTLAEYARAQKAHYSTLYDRVRASERRGGHGIQTRDEYGELRRQYRKDWQKLCKPIPRGRPNSSAWAVDDVKQTTHEEARAWCRMVATIYADAADLGYSPSAAIERIVAEHNRRQEMARRATDSDDCKQKEAPRATR